MECLFSGFYLASELIVTVWSRPAWCRSCCRTWRIWAPLGHRWGSIARWRLLSLGAADRRLVGCKQGVQEARTGRCRPDRPGNAGSRHRSQPGQDRPPGASGRRPAPLREPIKRKTGHAGNEFVPAQEAGEEPRPNFHRSANLPKHLSAIPLGLPGGNLDGLGGLDVRPGHEDIGGQTVGVELDRS